MPGAVGFITRFKRLKSNYYMRLGRARGLQLILREKCCTDYSQREHRRPDVKRAASKLRQCNTGANGCVQAAKVYKTCTNRLGAQWEIC